MLTAEEIELFAAAVHDAWMRENRKHGVTTAISRLTGEEQMVEYCELSEPVKEYDRAMVRTFLDVCDANGYEVVKRSESYIPDTGEFRPSFGPEYYAHDEDE